MKLKRFFSGDGKGVIFGRKDRYFLDDRGEEGFGVEDLSVIL